MSYILFPTALFKSAQYKHLSAESKLIYAAVLDRYRLSKKNKKTDKNGRVMVFYYRENLAELIGCSKRSVSRYIRELTDAGLIEVAAAPVGKSRPIYVKKFLLASVTNDSPEATDLPAPINNSQSEYSQSNILSHSGDGEEEEFSLQQIKENCELDIWYDGTGEMLECIIERLYYTDSLKVDGAKLDNRQIRSRLKALTADALICVIDSIKGKNLKNPQAYLLRAVVNAQENYMANCICDSVVV